MILHGIEYQRPTSLNMRIMADHVTYSFLAFMKSIFHFCLGCYCGGYSQNGRSNLSSLMSKYKIMNRHHPLLTLWSFVLQYCIFNDIYSSPQIPRVSCHKTRVARALRTPPPRPPHGPPTRMRLSTVSVSSTRRMVSWFRSALKTCLTRSGLNEMANI